jgi:hypothetical protein
MADIMHLENKHKRTVHFIHRDCKENTGDKVCNAGNYYDFPGYNKLTHDIYKPDFNKIKKDDIVIYSGGGLLNCIESWQLNINKSFKLCNNVYGWGIGFNAHYPTYGADVKTQINLSKFKHLGLRDYFKEYALDNMSYLPCSSCNLPQLQEVYEIKRKLGVVSHLGMPITYPSTFNNLLNVASITNMTDISKFIKFVGESKFILTNTYHCLYFSMLLNKTSILQHIFSQKFNNLKHDYIKNGEDIRTIDYTNYLQESIDLNNKFYDKLLKMENKL